MDQRHKHESILLGVVDEHLALPDNGAFRMPHLVRFAVRQAETKGLKRSPLNHLVERFSVHGVGSLEEISRGNVDERAYILRRRSRWLKGPLWTQFSRLTPLGLYGHRNTRRPSRPAVRPRATLARRETARGVLLPHVTNNFRRPAGVCGGSSSASPAAARAGGESTR